MTNKNINTNLMFKIISIALAIVGGISMFSHTGTATRIQTTATPSITAQAVQESKEIPPVSTKEISQPQSTQTTQVSQVPTISVVVEPTQPEPLTGGFVGSLDELDKPTTEAPTIEPAKDGVAPDFQVIDDSTDRPLSRYSHDGNKDKKY